MTDIAFSPVRAEVDSLEWVERLIQIDTATYHGNLALVGTVKEYLTGRGLAVETFTRQLSGAGELFTSIPDASGNVRGGIMFLASCDVASVAGQRWSSNPFRPEVRNGRLYGRGANSMKGFVGLLLGLVPVMTSATLSCPIHISLRYGPRGRAGTELAVDDAVSAFAADVQPFASISGCPTNLQVVRANQWIMPIFHVSKKSGAEKLQSCIHLASRDTALLAFTRFFLQHVAEASTGCLTSPQMGEHTQVSPAVNADVQRGAKAFATLAGILSKREAGKRNVDVQVELSRSDRGCLNLIWGPGMPRLVATEDEYVELVQLAKCSAGLKALVAELATDSM
ncbi:hypothetical protein P3T43_001619 [Paraburkholderia sp. GAS41]|jgi:hypothetical protein|uniref:M20/M25/M40 family metallo-hydrolase n=1 Tax=Paraburkholderia sp. GAS41 TaxID=3035134 RepID=UPI003D21886A